MNNPRYIRFVGYFFLSIPTVSDSRWHDGWARCLAGAALWHH